MAGRCELCDGKIINGKCTDCGMDYTRRKNRYHLNENCDDYDRNARKINDAYEKTLRGKNEPEDKGKKKEKTRLNSKASAKPNTQRKEEWSFEKVFSEEKTSVKTPPKKADGKKSSSKIGVIVSVFVAAFTVFGLVGELWEEFEDRRHVETTVYSELVVQPPEYDEDLPEMPDTDAEVGFEITTYGCFIAGTDIPAGIYTFKNEGSDYAAGISIEQPEYGLYENYYLNTDESVEGIRLYDGAMLRVDAGAVLTCTGHNAQIDAMHPWEGDVGEYIVVSAEEDKETNYTVGEDIAPGRYTVRYEGDGTSVIGIRTKSEAYTDYITLSNAKYDPNASQYIGLILHDGDTVATQKYGSDDAMVEFVPQEGTVEYLEGVF